MEKVFYLHLINEVIIIQISIATSGIILYPLVEIFHLPYCRLLVQYGSLQQQTLMKTLSDISLVSPVSKTSFNNLFISRVNLV